MPRPEEKILDVDGSHNQTPLVGVGCADPRISSEGRKTFGTTAVIPENAAVANALGAIASQIVTKVQTRVKAEYEGTQLKGYSVFEEDQKHMFDEYSDAEHFAARMVKNNCLSKAERQGLPETRKSK